MWHKYGILILKRFILAIRRNSCCKGYFFEWDEKTGRAYPSRGRHMKYFRIHTLIMTIIVQPILFFRCYQLTRNINSDLGLVYIPFATSALTMVALPFMWYFTREERPSEFIKCFESVCNLEKGMEGRNTN